MKEKAEFLSFPLPNERTAFIFSIDGNRKKHPPSMGSQVVPISPTDAGLPRASATIDGPDLGGASAGRSMTPQCIVARHFRSTQQIGTGAPHGHPDLEIVSFARLIS